jgi:hypothetical protein
MKPRLAYQVVLTMLALAPGCDGGSRFVSVGDGMDRQLPGEDPLDGATADGEMDGSPTTSDGSNTIMDGSAGSDGSSLDDLLLPDGSIFLGDGAIQLPDGEIIDQETAEMRYGTDTDVSTCEISQLDSITVPVSFGDEGGYALSASTSSGFAMVVNATSMTGCTSNIGVALLPSMGALPSPTPILPDCKITRDVAILGVSGGYHVAWVDNATETAELHRVLLDKELKPMGKLTRTTVTSSAEELEVRPVLAQVSSRPLLTWITRNAEANQRGVMAQFLDGDETETFEILGADEGHDPQALAVSRMSIEGRGALAWVGPQSNPGVWLQPLDDTGHPEGGPIKLTSRVGASSSVDLAPRVDGGGAVYSIVIDSLPQVRFHRLDEDGMPRGDERALVSPPQRAQDASIAGIGGGYAVAYRELPSAGQAAAEIRLMFISKEGNVTRDDQGRAFSFLIAESSLATGRTTVEVSLDGVLMIGWLDAAPTGSGNVLKVARRSLTCAIE